VDGDDPLALGVARQVAAKALDVGQLRHWGRLAGAFII
jgi:hypothetical protein